MRERKRERERERERRERGRKKKKERGGFSKIGGEHYLGYVRYKSVCHVQTVISYVNNIGHYTAFVVTVSQHPGWINNQLQRKTETRPHTECV